MEGARRYEIGKGVAVGKPILRAFKLVWGRQEGGESKVWW